MAALWEWPSRLCSCHLSPSVGLGLSGGKDYVWCQQSFFCFVFLTVWLMHLVYGWCQPSLPANFQANLVQKSSICGGRVGWGIWTLLKNMALWKPQLRPLHSLSGNFLLCKPSARWFEQLPIPEPAYRISLPPSMESVFFVLFNLIPHFEHAVLFD